MKKMRTGNTHHFLHSTALTDSCTCMKYSKISTMISKITLTLFQSKVGVNTAKSNHSMLQLLERHSSRSLNHSHSHNRNLSKKRRRRVSISLAF